MDVAKAAHVLCYHKIFSSFGILCGVLRNVAHAELEVPLKNESIGLALDCLLIGRSRCT